LQRYEHFSQPNGSLVNSIATHKKTTGTEKQINAACAVLVAHCFYADTCVCFLKQRFFQATFLKDFDLPLCLKGFLINGGFICLIFSSQDFGLIS
jgi:hypothetical protein